MGSHQTTEIRAKLARLWHWYAPPVPSTIRESLHAAQMENVRSQAPTLLAVATLNICIVIATCWQKGLPLHYYGWLSVAVVYCLFRMAVWRRLMAQPIPPENNAKIIRKNILMTMALMATLSIAASITFAAGLHGDELLLEVSLVLGTMSVAHCFYTVRPAAIGVLFVGVLPLSLSLMFFGDFSTKMLGASILSMAALMVRFVANQYDRLIAGLFLEHQIRDLANSDPLTGRPTDARSSRQSRRKWVILRPTEPVLASR
jgi:small basic protein